MRNPVWRNFFYGKEKGASTRSQTGQALLIVVLIIVVALTVGLSLASRSITNLRNTTDEANSQKAFSAAEAGVEQAIKTGKGIGSSIDLGNNSYISSVSATLLSGLGANNDEYLLNNGNPVFQDDGADIWLSPHDETPLFKTPWNQDGSQSFTLYWGTSSDPSGCSDPAIEVIVISSTSTNAPQLHATLTKYAFDSCPARRAGNHFFPPPSTGVSKQIHGEGNVTQTFNYWVDFSSANSDAITNGLLVRVIPLYTSGIFGVEALGLSPQGTYVTSVGTAGSSGQQTVRKVSFFQGYAGLPTELLYGIFSAN